MVRQADVPTRLWQTGASHAAAARFLKKAPLTGAILCSVKALAADSGRDEFPPRRAGPGERDGIDRAHGAGRRHRLSQAAHCIGADRLANAVAVKHHFRRARRGRWISAPTVTLDVVNGAGDYVGGIIAPGLNVMTDYLHEKTALLPRIRIREVKAAVGPEHRAGDVDRRGQKVIAG